MNYLSTCESVREVITCAASGQSTMCL